MVGRDEVENDMKCFMLEIYNAAYREMYISNTSELYIRK